MQPCTTAACRSCGPSHQFLRHTKLNMYAITTGNMTQLRILDLRNNQLTGWGGVPAFSDLPYLTTLHLSYNNLGERGSGLPL